MPRTEMLLPSIVSSPLKLLCLIFILAGALYIYYLVITSSSEVKPVFTINFTSNIQKPYEEVVCNRLKYKRVGRVKLSLEPLSWSQLKVKYASPQPDDYITSPEKRSMNELFGSFYGKFVATLLVSSTSNNNQGNIAHDRSKSYSTVREYNSPNIWSPLGCSANISAAIIIPYRNREEHLRILTNHLHGFLRHQRVSYTIFVIEQIGTTKFNRGALLNSGFLEVSRFQEYDCFVLHDVDKLPEDDRLTYTCKSHPLHFSSALRSTGYKLLYSGFFGGVVAFTREQFRKVNGFSNLYEGWGGEDDDLLIRVEKSGYKISRVRAEIGRYYSLSHEVDKFNEMNPNRFDLLKNASQRLESDGLNRVKYTVVNSKSVCDGLLHWISVDIHSLDKNN